MAVESSIIDAVIRKWGDSPTLRLPASAIKEAEFSLGQKVSIVVTRGRIVIEPSSKVEYDLNALLEGILLTARELEPYFIFGRTKAEFDIDSYGRTPEDLARTTAKIYLASQSTADKKSPETGPARSENLQE